MEQVLNSTFNGEPCTVEFSLTQGITPGTGSLSFPDINYRIPKRGTLVISDGITRIRFNGIFADKPRLESNANTGVELVATICDKRFTWQWGYIVGNYNKIEANGIPTKEKNLRTLLSLCLEALGETKYTFFDIPDEYPEVDWDFENPAIALEALCERFDLIVGLQTNPDMTVTIMPVKVSFRFSEENCTEKMCSITDDILPKELWIVGEKKILQRAFTDLIPVGEDLDGSIKKINELSYFTVISETYPDEKWGKEYIAGFMNITSETARKLAEKCVFKWYSINWESEYIKSRETQKNILPLLNIISSVITVEGEEKHDKPYVLGVREKWDGISHRLISTIGRLTEGYEVDEKLGIVKFGKPQYIPKYEGTIPESFIRPQLSLVASYEAKIGNLNDFVYWKSTINGGTELPVIYKDKKLIEYLVWNSNNNTWVSLNYTLLSNFVKELLIRLKQKYQIQRPKIYTYANVYDSGGSVGDFKSITWRVDLNGAETVLQVGIELPIMQMPTYVERLNKRKLSFLLSNIK